MNLFVHLLIAHSARKFVYGQVGARRKDIGFPVGSYACSQKAGELSRYLSDFFATPIPNNTTAAFTDIIFCEPVMLFLFGKGLLLFKKQKRGSGLSCSGYSFILENAGIYNNEIRLKILYV